MEVCVVFNCDLLEFRYMYTEIAGDSRNGSSCRLLLCSWTYEIVCQGRDMHRLENRRPQTSRSGIVEVQHRPCQVGLVTCGHTEKVSSVQGNTLSSIVRAVKKMHCLTDRRHRGICSLQSSKLRIKGRSPHVREWCVRCWGRRDPVSARPQHVLLGCGVVYDMWASAVGCG